MVNNCSDEDKLKWLKVQLTGQAQMAFQRLSAESQAKFQRAKEALKERFEPTSQKHRYQAELQVRWKRKGESWGNFADELKSLADKAYPNLQEEARERLALNGYLAQLDHPQVAFGVRQKNPENLDAAVTATLELETYVTPKSGMLSVSSVTDGAEDDEATVGAVGTADKLAALVEKLVERVERLESGQTGRQPPAERQYQSGQQRSVTRTKASSGATRGDFMCWNCHKPEHIA